MRRHSSTRAACTNQSHLYLAYPSNNTKQQGGRSAATFFHLWINNRGGPAHRPGPTPHSNKGTTPTPHLGGKQINSRCAPTPPPPDSNLGRAGGKNHKTAKLAAACSLGRLPPQLPSRLQLARLPITGIGKHKDMASWHHGIMASHATHEKGMECKRDRVCTVAARRTEPHTLVLSTKGHNRWRYARQHPQPTRWYSRPRGANMGFAHP